MPTEITNVLFESLRGSRGKLVMIAEQESPEKKFFLARMHGLAFVETCGDSVFVIPTPRHVNGVRGTAHDGPIHYRLIGAHPEVIVGAENMLAYATTRGFEREYRRAMSLIK